MARPSSVQTFHAPSTAGAAVDLNSYVTLLRTTLDGAGQEAINFSSPVVLTSPVIVEGADYPFFTRDLTVRFEAPPSGWKRKRLFLLAALRSEDNLGLSVPILDLPPDTTPIFVGKSGEMPILAWDLGRRRAALAAGRATSDAPGYSPSRIPSTTYTSTVCQILSELQRMMLEKTIDEGQTWESGLWTATEVLQYLNQRIFRFLVETGLVRERRTITAVSGTSLYDLPEDTIDIRRTTWNTGSAHSELTRIDPFALDHGIPGWQSLTGTPYSIIESPIEDLQIKVVPTPNAGGTIELVIVARPADAADCQPFVLPNLFIPYVKWGVVADMCKKEGEANDPQKAEYGEKRFREGIEIAKLLIGITL